MPNLPRISGREAVKVFAKIGYKVTRQRGSHIRMINFTDSTQTPLTIPDHRELGVGLLKKLIRDAQISIEEFKSLLK